MQIEVEKQILSEALDRVIRAYNHRSPLPILSHVLMDAQGEGLRLFVTDLDLGLRATVPASIAQSGAVCVPVKLFSDIVDKLPAAPVALVVEDAKMRIQCGRSKFEVPVLPAEEFPSWLASGGHPEINLPQDAFKSLVAHVIKVPPAQDEIRAVMTGVRVEIEGDKLILVATDGRRLAYAQHMLPDALNQQTACVVPGKAMTELARSCTIKEDMLLVRLAENMLWASSAGMEIYCRLLEGQFPDYRRVIPEEFQRTCRVGREALAAGLKRMLVVALERQSPNLIVFDFTPEKLTLSANTPDVGLGTEELPCIFEGADLRIAFNGKYVLDALTALACEEVQLDLQDDTRSAVVREYGESDYGESDFLHMLMPVRLREVVAEEEVAGVAG